MVHSPNYDFTCNLSTVYLPEGTRLETVRLFYVTYSSIRSRLWWWVSCCDDCMRPDTSCSFRDGFQ